MQTAKKNRQDLHLLVVEDEQELRELIVKTLKKSGYVNVTEAAGGFEALKLLETASFDLVLSDVRMPDGNGIILLDSIREKGLHDLVFVFLTGYADLSARECKERGAFAVLAKPCPRNVLIDTLDTALGLKDSNEKVVQDHVQKRQYYRTKDGR